MGYACPVCDAPQADGEHLANHLAFSALLRHDDHEDWLDEHAPDWSEDDPESLAATVVDHVEAVEYPSVFEDTTDHAHDHDDTGIPPGASGPAGTVGSAPDDELTPEAREILAEARELTEQRRRDDGSDAEEAGNGGDVDDGCDGADGSDGSGTGDGRDETGK